MIVPTKLKVLDEYDYEDYMEVVIKGEPFGTHHEEKYIYTVKSSPEKLFELVGGLYDPEEDEFTNEEYIARGLLADEELSFSVTSVRYHEVIKGKRSLIDTSALMSMIVNKGYGEILFTVARLGEGFDVKQINHEDLKLAPNSYAVQIKACNEKCRSRYLVVGSLDNVCELYDHFNDARWIMNVLDALAQRPATECLSVEANLLSLGETLDDREIETELMDAQVRTRS